ncbi:MAG: S9 family peptidase [Cytophagaceae bacterium]|nr:S9 family peptidase [Gemmatimonadaceae bacterium]
MSLRFVRSVAVAAAFIGTTAWAQRPMTIDDIMDLKNVGAVQVSPDGSRILYSISAWEHPAAKDTSKGDRHEMRSHVWVVRRDGSDNRQLTFGERGESAPQWSPDGKYISFVTARGTATGDEGPRPQIWLMFADGGEAFQLTTARDGAAGYAWSPDAKSIVYLTTDSLSRDAEARARRRDDPKVYEGDMRMSHAWVVDVASKKASKVTSGAFTVAGTPTWSPDGTRLAYLARPTTLIRDERREGWIVTVATRATEKIAGSANTTLQGTPVWSPDGKTLAFGAISEDWKPNADGMYPRSLRNTTMFLYDVASKQVKSAAHPSLDNNVGGMRWSKDGTRILLSVQDHVYSNLFEYTVATGQYRRLTEGLLVRGPSFSDDERTVAFAMDSPKSPADVYVTDATFANPRKVTTVNPQLAQLALGEHEVVTWKSPDGWAVEGVLLKPVGYTPGKRYPLKVDVHGGPTGAHTNGFKANWGSPGQFYAGQGWAVLYPNPRGSTGYGEKFMRGNIKDWGGGDYKDIMAGVDELVKRGLADSTRLAVTGWSYGGYMTGWVVSQTGRFKAAMMGAGLSNMESMYGTTDIPGYIGTFYDGMPQLDGTITNKSLEFYRSKSAVQYASKVTTPLLMLHGGNDERVPIGQPMEYFRNLKDRGKTVDLVFYPREGHGLGEYYHQIDKIRRENEWLTKFTLGQKVVQ